MAAVVSQTYSPSQNVSVTRKDGALVGVTLWTSGAAGKDTKRIS